MHQPHKYFYFLYGIFRWWIVSCDLYQSSTSLPDRVILNWIFNVLLFQVWHAMILGSERIWNKKKGNFTTRAQFSIQIYISPEFDKCPITIFLQKSDVDLQRDCVILLNKDQIFPYTCTGGGGGALNLYNHFINRAWFSCIKFYYFEPSMLFL